MAGRINPRGESSARFADDRDYWHKRFADRPEPLDLTEGSGTALAAHEVRRTAFSLSVDRYQALRVHTHRAPEPAERPNGVLLGLC